MIIIHKNRIVSSRKLWTPFAYEKPEFFNAKGNRFRNYYWILVLIGTVVGFIYVGVASANLFD